MASRRSLLMGALLIATGAALLLADAPRAEGPEGGVPDRPGPTALVAQAPSIARVWHGKTPRAKADEYQRYLTAAVAKFPSIKGNLGYQVMRLDDGGDTVEFQVTSYWSSLDAIKAYAGADVTRTRDLPRDPEFLVDMEPTVRNYRLVVNAVGP